MRRRTVLSLPALAATALGVAACGPPTEEDPLPPQDTGEDGGTGATGPAEGRVDYGEDPSQFAELTLPEGGPRGVVVLLHGGFWKAQYGAEYARPLVPSLAAAGWAVWVVEYRRVGSGTGGGGGVPETLDDVAAAIDALRDQDLDLSTVVAVGHSAGGHLAAWAASRLRFDPWRGGVPLTHVVSQAGVLDLVAADEAGLGGGAVGAFLGHPAGPDDAPVDPRQQLPLDVPLWCVHATGDTTVPIEQSRSYVAAATAAGAEADLVEVEGDHFTVIDPSSDAWARTLAVLDGIG